VARRKSSPEQITDIDVGDEMRHSFLEYAYSVIYARALPDARDGLKPVQRRILFQMSQMGLRPDRGHVKSARVVGEVMGRLHPHGDSAIYDALVRMAQPFTLRMPLIDGHGNFGSLDDGPAAMRYTEARLAPAALPMTASIDEDVVDFVPNYDGRESEPIVLPAAFPNLLVNGASGIAVGMATSLVPHNLGEVISAAKYLLDHPKAQLDTIMTFIPGPDLPGGGVILGLDGIREAYESGRGSFKVRARTRIEQVTARKRGIVVTELPMNIGPERVIERIKDLVLAKKLQGISDVVDLTDGNQGLNLVIEVKNGFHPEAVLEELFRLTPLEDNVNINAVALVDGQPRTLGLLDLLTVYLDHRRDVIRRRSEYRRTRATDRLHLVEGLLIAIVDIDEVIELIRASQDAAAAKLRLIEVFDLTELQADYILDMPLRRLTKFSRIELETQADELRSSIESLTLMLEDESVLRDALRDELSAVAHEHATPRRTLLSEYSAPMRSIDDLEIADEPCVVLLASTGLIARTSDVHVDGSVEAQRGKHDVITAQALASTRGDVGLVSSLGLIYRLPVMEIPGIPPVAGIPSLAAGAPIGAFLDTKVDEHIIGLLPLDGHTSITLATSSGRVKRVAPDHPSNKAQWDVIPLQENEYLVAAIPLAEQLVEHTDIVLITSDAQVLRFPASAVRAQGRSAGGMAGIRCTDGAKVVGAGLVEQGREAVLVTVAGSSTALPGTEAGMVKVTDLSVIPIKGRGTSGVRGHRFRKGHDTILLASAVHAPARASSAAGVAIPLPDPDQKRDGSGIEGQIPIAGISGTW
jgi:DNA gyrase subunit A